MNSNNTLMIRRWLQNSPQMYMGVQTQKGLDSLLPVLEKTTECLPIAHSEGVVSCGRYIFLEDHAGYWHIFNRRP